MSIQNKFIQKIICNKCKVPKIKALFPKDGKICNKCRRDQAIEARREGRWNGVNRFVEDQNGSSRR